MHKKICLLSREIVIKEQLEAMLVGTDWRLAWQSSWNVQPESCDVALLGDDFWTEKSDTELAGWKKKIQNAQIVMLSPLSRRREMQRLVRIFADDYLILPLDQEEVFAVLQKCEERIRKNSPQSASAGKVVVCFSPLGRSGKTSLAINLAVALGEQSPGGVALLDLAAPFGDIALAAGVSAGESVDEMILGVASDRQAIWRERLTRFGGYSVWVGPAAASITGHDEDNYGKMVLFLNSLRQQFSFVVIDTATEFRDVVIAALDAADEVLLLAVLEQVSSVKNVKVCLEIFRSLGYDERKVRLILNRSTAKYNLQTRDVESVLNYPVVRRLPNNFAVVRRSLVSKMPYIKSEPQDDLSVEVNSLAAALLSGSWEPEQRSGWKGFFKRFS